MTLSLDEIVDQTRDLPPDVVAELVDRIWAARNGQDPEAAQEWKAEIERRVSEIRSGKVKGVPVDEALERVRRKLRQ